MQRRGRFASLRAPTTPVTPAPLACSAVHLSSVNLIIAAPDTGEAEMKPGRETCYRPKFCLFLLHLPAITHRYGFYSENCDTAAKNPFFSPTAHSELRAPSRRADSFYQSFSSLFSSARGKIPFFLPLPPLFLLFPIREPPGTEMVFRSPFSSQRRRQRGKRELSLSPSPPLSYYYTEEGYQTNHRRTMPTT